MGPTTSWSLLVPCWGRGNLDLLLPASAPDAVASQPQRCHCRNGNLTHCLLSGQRRRNQSTCLCCGRAMQCANGDQLIALDFARTATAMEPSKMLCGCTHQQNVAKLFRPCFDPKCVCHCSDTLCGPWPAASVPPGGRRLRPCPQDPPPGRCRRSLTHPECPSPVGGRLSPARPATSPRPEPSCGR